MKPASFLTLAAPFAATIAMTFAVSGCGNPSPKTTVASGSEKTTPPEPPKKEPIKAGTGTVKGKIVFASDPPKEVEKPEIAANKDCAACIPPEGKYYMKCDQTWIVAKDKSVANVLVRLKVPDGHYFEASADDLKKRATEKVILQQPCCAFEPHVLLIYPKYYDGKDYKATGQILHVENNAKFLHNTNIKGNPKIGNEPPSKSIPVGESEDFKLSPQDSIIDIICDVHPMMKAKMFSLDHPYAAVTKMDGVFEIKNVPIGHKLTVEFWHEANPSFKTPDEITLAANEIKDYKEISISAK